MAVGAASTPSTGTLTPEHYRLHPHQKNGRRPRNRSAWRGHAPAQRFLRKPAGTLLGVQPLSDRIHGASGGFKVARLDRALVEGIRKTERYLGFLACQPAAKQRTWEYCVTKRSRGGRLSGAESDRVAGTSSYHS